MAHKVFLIMGQHDFILVDDPGIAGLAGADIRRNPVADKEGVDDKFQHPGEIDFGPGPVKRGNKNRMTLRPFQGGSAQMKVLLRKSAAVRRVLGPFEIGGGQAKAAGGGGGVKC